MATSPIKGFAGNPSLMRQGLAPVAMVSPCENADYDVMVNTTGWAATSVTADGYTGVQLTAPAEFATPWSMSGDVEMFFFAPNPATYTKVKVFAAIWPIVAEANLNQTAAGQVYVKVNGVIIGSKQTVIDYDAPEDWPDLAYGEYTFDVPYYRFRVGCTMSNADPDGTEWILGYPAMRLLVQFTN